jgi:hypothetical protein
MTERMTADAPLATTSTQPPEELMERVTGIGGMFFRARDPDALARWYAEHLGIDNQLEGGDTLWWQERGPTVFAPFPADTDYFGRPEQAWTLNLRGSRRNPSDRLDDQTDDQASQATRTSQAGSSTKFGV